MRTRLTIKPGKKGTKRFLETYGDSLVCVRYRYDEETQTRLTTIEIIVDRKKDSPARRQYVADDLVPVRIAFEETALQEIAKSSRGKWDPKAKVWLIRYGRIKGTELESRVVQDSVSFILVVMSAHNIPLQYQVIMSCRVS